MRQETNLITRVSWNGCNTLSSNRSVYICIQIFLTDFIRFFIFIFLDIMSRVKDCRCHANLIYDRCTSVRKTWFCAVRYFVISAFYSTRPIISQDL